MNANPLPLGVGATGTVFRLHFLGSVEVDEEGGRKRRKRLKKNMVEVAVTKIKVCVFLTSHFVLIGTTSLPPPIKLDALVQLHWCAQFLYLYMYI